MTKFDFSTLNAFDFEELVCDLLNAEEQKNKSNIKYQGFPNGPDMGVDLIHSTQNHLYRIIVQIKHFDQNNLSQLKHSLFKKRSLSDLQKVKKLNPMRYKLVTSMGLSLKTKMEIKNNFEPYIQSISDIIDRTDLNALLREHPKIVKAHFKLFFSDISVLEKIMNNEVIGRSEFSSNQLQNRIKKYVKTTSYTNARELLHEKYFILITGEPGVGKTTLAELLLYELLGLDYQLIYIIDNVKDAEKMLRNDDSKQVFYFDDFLGHTALEIEQASLKEASLLNFINRIKSAKNKALILTTRTPIYHDALYKSERFKRSNLDYNNYRVHLTNFSFNDKIKLIRNHILVSTIPEEYKKILWEEKVQKYIALHDNFFPRLVEFITDETKLLNIPPSGYFNFITSTFNSPSEIWLHSYEQQLNESDRVFISTLFSFGDIVKKDVLSKAFEFRIKRLNYNQQNFGFNWHLKKLLEGYVTLVTANDSIVYVSFINPSLIDFLKSYFQNNDDQSNSILENALYIEQIITRFRDKNKFKLKKLFITINASELFLLRINSIEIPLLTIHEQRIESERNYVVLYRTIILLMFYPQEIVMANSITNLRKVNFSKIQYCNSLHIIDLLNVFNKNAILFLFFKSNLSSIADIVINNTNEIETLSKFKSTIYIFEKSFSSFIKKNYLELKIVNIINEYYIYELRYIIENLKINATRISQVNEAWKDYMLFLKTELNKFEIDNYSLDPSDFNSCDWELICETNYKIERESQTGNRFYKLTKADIKIVFDEELINEIGYINNNFLGF